MVLTQTVYRTLSAFFYLYVSKIGKSILVFELNLSRGWCYGLEPRLQIFTYRRRDYKSRRAVVYLCLIMLNISSIHHVAIICSDYVVSKKFYTEVLGLEIISEQYRGERESYKLDLRIGDAQIELFSFRDTPERVSRPEARGLRHLAFATDDLDRSVEFLKLNNVEVEPVRLDELTGKRFTFFSDPDRLPLELYEI